MMKSLDYKALSKREFDKAAARFDSDEQSIYKMCRKDYPDILAEIQQESWQTVLDAGCGTGEILYLLHKKYPNKNYYGIDFSEKMIAVAEQKNKNAATLVCGDCEALPFPNCFFDVVICSMSFHHYPHPEAFFMHVNRVLKHGGRFILRDITASSALARWFMNHIELPIVNRIFKKGDVHTYSEQEITALCQAANLTLESFACKKGFRLHAVIRKN